MEGFDHVVVRAAREGIDHVARRRVGREKQDGQDLLFVPTNQTTELDAAHLGQVPIEDEQVEVALLNRRKSIFGAFFGRDDELNGGEHRGDDCANVGIIVDDEDACTTTGTRRPRDGFGRSDFVVEFRGFGCRWWSRGVIAKDGEGKVGQTSVIARFEHEACAVGIDGGASCGRGGFVARSDVENGQDPLAILDDFFWRQVQLELAIPHGSDSTFELPRVGKPKADAPHAYTLHPGLAPRKGSD